MPFGGGVAGRILGARFESVRIGFGALVLDFFGNIFRPILGTILGSGVGKVSECCSQKLSNETKIEKKCVSRCF